MTSPGVQVAVFVGCCLAANALLFVLAPQPVASAPHDLPGWLVGGVWTLLFGCFGLAHALMQRRRATSARRAIVALAVLCLAYPLYTRGLSDRAVGLLGNAVTASAAAALAARLWRLDARAALLVAPVVPWLAVASWTTLQA